MELIKRRCKKEQYSAYYDLFLVWEYEGKKYNVRIRPMFYNRVKPLLAHAREEE